MPKVPPTKVNNVTIQRLIEEMEGMNRKDICSESGMPYSLLGMILNGKKPLVRQKAELLGRYFGVRPEYLMNIDDDRTEDDHIETIRKIIGETKNFTPTISKTTALSVFYSYLGITDDFEYLIMDETKTKAYKITKGSKDYYLTDLQYKTIVQMIEAVIEDQIIPIMELLQPGNKNLAEAFRKKQSEYKKIDTRSSEEIIKEVQEIKSNPNTARLDF